MMSLPKGIIHSPLMPFTTDGDLDLAKLRAQIDYLIGESAAGICLFLQGSEVFNLRGDERREVAEYAAEVIADRVPFFVHVSTSATHHSSSLAQHAQSLGAKGVLLSPPYYWRLSAKEEMRHFRSVADSIDIGLMLYNLPRYNGDVSVGLPVITDCVENIPNFLGVVDNSLNYLFLAQLYALMEGKKPVLSTDTDYMLPTGQLGVRTWFSSLGNIAPKTLQALHDAILAGDLESAAELQHRVSRIIALLGDRTSPYLKAAGDIVDRSLGEPRLPLRSIERQHKKLLSDGLKANSVNAEVSGWG